jgi:hypothetical protein
MARIFLQTGDSSITISGPSTILPLSSKITGNFKIILGTSTATADLSKIGKAAASTVVEIQGPSTDYNQVVSKGYVYVLAGASTDLKSAVVKLPIAKNATNTLTKLHFSDYKTDVTVTKDGGLDHAPDGTTAVNLAASTTSIDEGQTVTYTATLASPAPVGGVKVPYTLSGISAADFDLTSLTGTIAIAAGKTTGTLVLNAAADNTTEGVETLSIALQTAPRVELGAITTASTTIIDSSKTPLGPPTVSLTSSATTADETTPNNLVTYTATLTTPATSALSIPYTLAGTGITAGDFVGLTGLTGNISIAVGETTGTLVLTNAADTTTEGTENVTVSLGSATGVILGTTTTASTTIADTSKTIPSVTLTSSTTTIDENASNNAVTYTATLSSPATSALSIPYTLGGTATATTDYTTASTGTINIAAGATTGTLVLNTVTDATTEGAETVTVALSNTVSGVNVNTAALTTTINDTSLTGATTTTNISSALTTATATAAGDTFNIASGAYSATISGFGQAGADKLVFFPGAILNIVNDTNQTDGIQQYTADNGASVITTITLTGLTAAQDAGLFNATNSFISTFGSGSIL